MRLFWRLRGAPYTGTFWMACQPPGWQSVRPDWFGHCWESWGSFVTSSESVRWWTTKFLTRQNQQNEEIVSEISVKRFGSVKLRTANLCLRINLNSKLCRFTSILINYTPKHLFWSYFHVRLSICWVHTIEPTCVSSFGGKYLGCRLLEITCLRLAINM